MPEIKENDVDIVAADNDQPIQYFVDSCLTVTCGFTDGTRIGAHFSHSLDGARGANWTYDNSVRTWEFFSDVVQSKIHNGVSATWVIVRGDKDGWNPGYLTTRP